MLTRHDHVQPVPRWRADYQKCSHCKATYWQAKPEERFCPLCYGAKSTPFLWEKAEAEEKKPKRKRKERVGTWEQPDIPERTCQNTSCGKTYKPANYNSKFCSLECQREREKAKDREKNKAKQFTVVCICNKTFTTSVRSQKTCSAKCRNKRKVMVAREKREAERLQEQRAEERRKLAAMMAAAGERKAGQ